VNAKPATILCVDDDSTALNIRRLLLESVGYRTLSAESGREALTLFQSEPIDLVVLDYWMGGMNGVALAQEIKRLKPAIPIIILSGYAELPGEATGLAHAWIRKGEDSEYFLSKVKELLQR